MIPVLVMSMQLNWGLPFDNQVVLPISVPRQCEIDERWGSQMKVTKYDTYRCQATKLRGSPQIAYLHELELHQHNPPGIGRYPPEGKARRRFHWRWGFRRKWHPDLSRCPYRLVGAFRC